MRCPNCGGLNPETAAWCGQCFAKFSQPEPDPPERPAKAVEKPGRVNLADLQEAPVIYDRGFLRRQRELMGWQCHKCGKKNSMDRMDCESCGASLFESFGVEAAPPEEPPPKNARLAALLSVLPGAGHLYIGRIGEGVTRLMVAAWWLAAGAILLSAGALKWLGLIFILADLSLIGLSVTDAFRQAIDRKTAPIFSPKLLLYSNVVLVCLLAAGGMVAATMLRR